MSGEKDKDKPRRLTRHTSKSGENDDNEINKDPNVPKHSQWLATLSRNRLQKKVRSLDTEEQMGNILTVMNKLECKITEMDISLNHDTDGMNTRITMATAASDTNFNEISTLKTTLEEVQGSLTTLLAENVVLKGIVHRHNQQLHFSTIRLLCSQPRVWRRISLSLEFWNLQKEERIVKKQYLTFYIQKWKLMRRKMKSTYP